MYRNGFLLQLLRAPAHRRRRARPAAAATLAAALWAAAALWTTTFAPPAAAADLPPPAPPEVGAKSYILADFQSGAVIAEKNADLPADPASITKIMAAYVVYKALAKGLVGLGDMVTISEKAWRTEGSRTFVEVGKQVSVEDLLLGVVVQSGNDANVALAEHVAGTEEQFAAMMNAEAKAMGLENTRFVNSTGMPADNHMMSARDIMIMSRALIRDFPEYYADYARKHYTYNEISQYNRNKLLWHNLGVDGIKTGYTEAAGYCLAASAVRDGMRLISVVMGSTDADKRASESAALLNYGFRFYQTRRVYRAGQTIETLRVWGGDPEQVAVGVAEDLYVTVPRDSTKKLRIESAVPRELEAPIAAGRILGTITARYDERLAFEAPLTALADAPQGGWFIRVRDFVVRLF